MCWIVFISSSSSRTLFADGVVFLNETKRHHHIRVIDRALACRPEMLALEDR
nr:hypothetical protein [Exiguobacterium sp. s161]